MGVLSQYKYAHAALNVNLISTAVMYTHTFLSRIVKCKGEVKCKN